MFCSVHISGLEKALRRIASSLGVIEEVFARCTKGDLACYPHRRLLVFRSIGVERRPHYVVRVVAQFGWLLFVHLWLLLLSLSLFLNGGTSVDSIGIAFSGVYRLLLARLMHIAMSEASERLSLLVRIE